MSLEIARLQHHKRSPGRGGFLHRVEHAAVLAFIDDSAFRPQEMPLGHLVLAHTCCKRDRSSASPIPALSGSRPPSHGRLRRLRFAAFAPSFPKAVRVFFGKCATVRLFFATRAAFFTLRRAAVLCLELAIACPLLRQSETTILKSDAQIAAHGSPAVGSMLRPRSGTRVRSGSSRAECSSMIQSRESRPSQQVARRSRSVAICSGNRTVAAALPFFSSKCAILTTLSGPIERWQTTSRPAAQMIQCAFPMPLIQTSPNKRILG